MINTFYYIPSTIRTILQFRSGAIPSLHDPTFLKYRLAGESSYCAVTLNFVERVIFCSNIAFRALSYSRSIISIVRNNFLGYALHSCSDWSLCNVIFGCLSLARLRTSFSKCMQISFDVISEYLRLTIALSSFLCLLFRQFYGRALSVRSSNNSEFAINIFHLAADKYIGI